MKNKPKSSQNKAKDVETKLVEKDKIEKLWAQYGRLQAMREQLTANLQKIIEQMRQAQKQIELLEKKNG